MVDQADTSIAGNVTQMTLGQNLDKFTFGNVFTQCLDFGNPLYDPSGYSGTPDTGSGDGDGDGDPSDGNTGKCKPNFSVVKSGTFYATGYTEDLVNLTLSDGSTSLDSDRNGIHDSLQSEQGRVNVGLSYSREILESDINLLSSIGFDVSVKLPVVDALLLGDVNASDIWQLSNIEGVVMVERK